MTILNLLRLKKWDFLRRDIFMYYELWGNDLSKFCYLFDKEDITLRVYLEDHLLIDDFNVGDMDVLSNMYSREMLRSKDNMRPIDCLLEISGNWFNVISCYDTYVTLKDYIVFDCKKGEFELLSSYSSFSEKYAESFDEDFGVVIYNEGAFDIVQEVEVNSGSQLIIYKSDSLEEYVYTVKNSDCFLIVKNDLEHGTNRGIIVSEDELEEYIRNKCEEDGYAFL
jgi:hypothetical protein